MHVSNNTYSTVVMALTFLSGVGVLCQGFVSGSKR